MIQDQDITLNFSQGLDTKTDPLQVTLGKFLVLSNMIFTKAGLLAKRNGFGLLPTLPDTSGSYLTTYNSNLTVLGTKCEALSAGTASWINKGSIQPVTVNTLSLIRSGTNQIQCDSVTAANGLVCVVYTDNQVSAGAIVASYRYAILDSTTGQNVVAPTVIPVSTGTVTGSPRVFLLGSYFVIVFTNVITAVNHLQYVAVSTMHPTTVTANTDITSQYTPASTVAWDGVVANNNLYLAWNGNDGGGAIRFKYISSNLSLSNTVAIAGSAATIMSLTADMSGPTPVIWAAFYNLGTTAGKAIALDQNLLTLLAATSWIAAGTIPNVTATATGNVLSIFYETTNAYSYDSGVPTNFISTKTVTLAGSVSSATVVKRSVGLASKAFFIDSTVYFLASYSSANQPTTFLIQSNGNILAKLATGNGNGYLTKGLPGVTVDGTAVSVPFLIKDLITSVNKETATSAIYSQTGISLSTFDLTTEGLGTSEIGQNLHISGGFLWMYDGYNVVEHGFFVWPDQVEATWSATGGSIVAQPDGSTNTNAYAYQVIYQWADNQGNLHRSAPSIPIFVTTTSNGSSGSITVNVPTLRLTYKTANAVSIVIYRWSVAHQSYYQVTSVAIPQPNSVTVDSIAYVDTLADSSIIGNSLIYTTGGVLENIQAPATHAMALFKSRLFLVDSEDRNLLWYSKQVIETTPVETTDLFTIYVAPTTGAQENTGPITALAAMDDKLIIFKEHAILYLVGAGPDNTGASNDYSDPVFVTSTVGCSVPKSIVLMPNGLMFQSDKGIWLLGRDLSTTYIGAPVEQFNSSVVNSASCVPETNMVRFTLDTGEMLMYDYFYGQWGVFNGVPAISSTIYTGLHTFINSSGQALRETPGTYLDGTRPVLMGFTTSWIRLTGLQGFQRARCFYLLATYLSPHRLSMGIAYDFAPGIAQDTIITPDNYNPRYGGDSLYGDSVAYGGNTANEQWLVYLDRQKCQAVQITLQEIYDSSFSQVAGAGFTMSGITLTIGVKSGHPRLPSSRQTS